MIPPQELLAKMILQFQKVEIYWLYVVTYPV